MPSSKLERLLLVFVGAALLQACKPEVERHKSLHLCLVARAGENKSNEVLIVDYSTNTASFGDALVEVQLHNTKSFIVAGDPLYMAIPKEVWWQKATEATELVDGLEIAARALDSGKSAVATIEVRLKARPAIGGVAETITVFDRYSGVVYLETHSVIDGVILNNSWVVCDRERLPGFFAAPSS